MSQPMPLAGPKNLPVGKATSMVIFLHGYGSNGADLMSLAPYWRPVLPGTVFLTPNAPQPCPGAPDGYQWWALTDLSPTGRAAGVRQSAPALDAYIDAELAAHGLSEDRLALVGFSQGTMMALHVGPRRAKALAGVVGYSGMLADAEALAAEAVTKPPILLIHGDADPTLPVASLFQAKAALEAGGFAVEGHVSRGLGHSIDEAGLRLGGEFLAKRLG